MTTSTIGAPLPRVDGRLKVTGGAKYAAEFKLPDLAYAVLVQSTIARGRAVGFDTGAAEAAPGVLLVMTPRNAPRLARAKEGVPDGADFPLLQDDRVLYNGQHIALVVAESFEEATHAAQLVRVRYADEQPSLAFDRAPERLAMPKKFRNGMRPADSRRGDPDGALASAEVRVDEIYSTPTEHHNPMEPHATIALWQGEELTLFNAVQGVSAARNTVAKLLGVAPEKVRVITPFVGGGFGCKGNPWPHMTLAAMAAREVRRPVKLVLTRRQMFTSNGYRPATSQRVALGATRDGRLTAIRHDGVTQSSLAGEFAEPVGLASEMLYSCPNVGVTHRLVDMNTGVPTYMRAPGEASGVYALECAMDELAAKLAVDPIELRLRNYAQSDEHEGRPWSSKSLDECYRGGAEVFGWARRNPLPGSMRQGRAAVGLGMASATYPGNRSPAGARVALMPDGTALVQSGTQDIGTGTYTIMAQVAAETLGLPIERIRVQLGDTRLPEAPISGGSQTIASVAPAVREAALQARAQLLAAASQEAPFAGLSAAEIEIADGLLQARGDPSRQAPIDVVLGRRSQPIEAVVAAKPGEVKKQFSIHSFGAHFVELHVDSDLGEIRVARYVGAFAAGRVMNAKTARSQMIGGIVFGLGMALLEETWLDRRSGRIVNAGIADYLVPVHADVPGIEVMLIDEPEDKINALGAKGMGELPMVGVAAAVANAVYHATGKRVRDLPITIDKLIA